jgi:hypothetical protein
MSALTALVNRSVAMAQPRAQDYAEGNMQAVVRITRPAPNDFDRSTGTWTNPTDINVYEGPARIYEMNGGLTYALGEEAQYFSQSYVSVPLSAPLIQVNDDVRVLIHPDSTLVAERGFRWCRPEHSPGVSGLLARRPFCANALKMSCPRRAKRSSSGFWRG